MAPERLRRLPGAGLLAAGLLWLGGCATPVEWRTLATGRADTEAFELRGADMATLRREAQRRCPQGGEVLRQAESGQPPAAVDAGRLSRWADAALAWADPPQRQAQLLVLCHPDPQRQTLAAAVRPSASPASAAPVASVAAPTTAPTLLARMRSLWPSPGKGPRGDRGPAAPPTPPEAAAPIGPIDPTW